MVDRLFARQPAAPARNQPSPPRDNPVPPRGQAPPRDPAIPADETGQDSVAALEASVWARVQRARALGRPRTIELIGAMTNDFVELHGDRLYRDDAAIVGGLATIDGRRVMVIGNQKGAETDENIRRNFGMAHPEGYRKAMRLMALAERFRLPIVSFVDTPGASPGPGAEERGVAEAIASSIGLMSRLRTPIVTVITGEGGSGGALAIAVGDVVIALENAVYSVITPEGCAAILWRSADLAPRAAVAMKMTALEQQALGVVDLVVDEPPGGAHTDHAGTAQRLKPVIVAQLDALVRQPIDALLEARYRRYRSIGQFTTVTPPPVVTPERPGFADRLRGLFEVGRQTLGGPVPVFRGRDEPPAREEV
ncbi:MAG TPA: acetyl-CoA carboxylase carboxyltransferase subunit alpha [Candidatus Saccharimonadales bacterium]|nr:acetyl-CoA carboxylase carboxyltransferase subunit alpha [Candidatus Saccharimonadales bacterium]